MTCRPPRLKEKRAVTCWFVPTQCDAIRPLDVCRHQNLSVHSVHTRFLYLGWLSPVRPVQKPVRPTQSWVKADHQWEIRRVSSNTKMSRPLTQTADPPQYRPVLWGPCWTELSAWYHWNWPQILFWLRDQTSTSSCRSSPQRFPLESARCQWLSYGCQCLHACPEECWVEKSSASDRHVENLSIYTVFQMLLGLPVYYPFSLRPLYLIKFKTIAGRKTYCFNRPEEKI